MRWRGLAGEGKGTVETEAARAVGAGMAARMEEAARTAAGMEPAAVQAAAGWVADSAAAAAAVGGAAAAAAATARQDLPSPWTS